MNTETIVANIFSMTESPAADLAKQATADTSTSGKILSPPPGVKLTPMMERFFEVKRQHPASLLLFRMGDFYELFFDDAVIAAKILGLTLTSRDKGSSNPVAMAGFPYHSLDNYLQKLIRAGQRAAICDQVEDPKQAQGLVKREVTRIVTAGTLTEDSLLDPRENNYLAAVVFQKERAGLAWLELSTGRFQVADLNLRSLTDELARIQPAELLIDQESQQLDVCQHLLRELDQTQITERPPWSFSVETCYERLCDHFHTRSLEGFDIDDRSAAVTAAGALLEYVQETQRTALDHLLKIERYRSDQRVHIDEASRRSLEISHTLRDGKREGTLLDVLDLTTTPMGARLLAEWVSNPLTNLSVIEARADAVQEWTTNSQQLRLIREQLNQAYDLQRLASRVATGRCSPKDLVCLVRTLELLPELKQSLVSANAKLLQDLNQRTDLCADICTDIQTCLADDPPLNISDGNLIRAGYHSKLDELRELSRGGKEWIARYQATEIERTGIQNLKIGYNKVFGYYLEVTAAQAHKVPENYLRKQTLKNQERFITPALKEHEEKVLTADQRALALEAELFHDLRQRTASHLERLQQTANALAELDVLASFAESALRHQYVRPHMTTDPVLHIVEGRHPVLDVMLPGGQFVPNDIFLGKSTAVDSKGDAGRVQIITGPNMAGKSTYIRQAALLTLMAQIGSFVPARSAIIGLVDRIFARVGASDELSKGQSTFMVEMTETARILNTATEKSLVILDEIGRGTSTYDGLSLAWSVTEYLHDHIRARTLFATHYHELTELEQTLPAARNWNVSVFEKAGEVVFLHKIVPGAADRSYGIHVARLAGVPSNVLERAAEILQTLENDHINEAGKPTIPPRSSRPQKQLTLFDPPPHPVLEKLKQLDLDQLSPKAALDHLYKLRGDLKS